MAGICPGLISKMTPDFFYRISGPDPFMESLKNGIDDAKILFSTCRPITQQRI